MFLFILSCSQLQDKQQLHSRDAYEVLCWWRNVLGLAWEHQGILAVRTNASFLWKHCFFQDSGKHLWCPAIPNSQVGQQFCLCLFLLRLPLFLKWGFQQLHLSQVWGTRTPSRSSKDIYSSTGRITEQWQTRLILEDASITSMALCKSLPSPFFLFELAVMFCSLQFCLAFIIHLYN